MSFLAPRLRSWLWRRRASGFSGQAGRRHRFHSGRYRRQHAGLEFVVARGERGQDQVRPRSSSAAISLERHHVVAVTALHRAHPFLNSALETCSRPPGRILPKLFVPRVFQVYTNAIQN